MGLIKVSPTTDPQRAAAIRARLLNPPNAYREPVKVTQVRSVPSRSYGVTHLWNVQHDSHVIIWRLAKYQERIASLETQLREREDMILHMVPRDDIPRLPSMSAVDVCTATLARCAAEGLGSYTMSEILDRRRQKSLVFVRHRCMAAVVQTCRHLSYPQIGKFFGRHHSSVLHATKKLGAAR